jgi:hypothetical protein
MTRWTARQSLRSNRFAADLTSAVISTLEVRLSSGAKPKHDSQMSDVLQVCSGDILGNLPDEMSGEKTFSGGNVQSADVTIEALSDEAIVIKGIVLWQDLGSHIRPVSSFRATYGAGNLYHEPVFPSLNKCSFPSLSILLPVCLPADHDRVEIITGSGHAAYVQST